MKAGLVARDDHTITRTIKCKYSKFSIYRAARRSVERKRQVNVGAR